MFHATMRCHLWDLVDEGIDDVLDRLKGEAGITGVSVPLVCPPVEQLRPHNGVTPRTFRSRGGVQFQPRAEFYANTRLRPVVAEWLRKSNPLPQVAEACAKRGLTLRGEINCCHSPVMVERYPFAAVKDVFGEVKPDTLCPINRDVQQYLRGLIAELREHYGVQHIELHALKWNIHHRAASEITDVDPELHGRNAAFIIYDLMYDCFCESCLQHADDHGVGAAGVVRELQRGLEQLFLSGDTLESAAAFSSKVKGLDAYESTQLRAVADFSQSLEVTFGDDENRVGVHLPVTMDSAMLVRLVSRYVAEGAASITFEDYGDMPLARLPWIKQAVRKAQRDAG